MKKTFIKTLAVLILIFCSHVSALSEENMWHNDLRQLFLSNNAVIYALVVRTFNAKDLNGNELIEPDKNEESGTFINAVERLDELKNLGINTLHLLPVTKTGRTNALGNAGSLYSMASFSELEPSLGDKNKPGSVKEEAAYFINECHKRNIRVMFDLPACISYDFSPKKSKIFFKDKNGNPINPLSWKDVRLIKALNDDGSLNQEVLNLHKQFIDLCLSLGVDGIRADVAPLKPPALWKELIKYARSKDPNFAFLAESSDFKTWTAPIYNKIKPNNYNQLLEQGFDAYYGSYFMLDDKEWKTADELNKQVISNLNLSNKYADKKSVIGSFVTHDEPSPISTGGVALSKMIVMLNATLPMMNPYFISGFESGDKYNYGYAGKPVQNTITDSKVYFVHPNKLDIFNFSRKPEGNHPEIAKLMKHALKFREENNELITKGSFIPLETENKQIIAFARCYNDKTLIFIANRDFKTTAKIKLLITGLNNAKEVINFACCSNTQFSEDQITSELMAGETQVFIINNFNLEKYSTKIYRQKF